MTRPTGVVIGETGSKRHLVADDAERAGHWPGARKALCGTAVTINPSATIWRGATDTVNDCQTCERIIR